MSYRQRRAKMLLTSQLTQVRAENAEGDRNKVLTAKMLKMKEDITFEATARTAAMHDREERAALASAAAALRRGDTEHAMKILQTRMAKVQRRIGMRGQDSDSDEEESLDKESESNNSEKASMSLQEQNSPGPSIRDSTVPMSRDDWIDVAKGCMSIRGVGSDELGLAEHIEVVPCRERIAELRSKLDSSGFLMSDEVVGFVSERVEKIMKGMVALRDAGLPTFCVWMYDEPWEVMRVMWRRAEAIMGGDCVLEPTVAAYHLNHKAASTDGNRYVGTNFALPHRDYTYGDTYDAEGKPQLLTVWVPVAEVTVDNGCMYVVPREFDANFERDDMQQHMLVQSTGWLAGKSFLRYANTILV